MSKFEDHQEMNQALSGVEERAAEWDEKVAKFEKRQQRKSPAFRKQLALAILMALLMGMVGVLFVFEEGFGRQYIGITFLWVLAIALIGVSRKMFQKSR